MMLVWRGWVRGGGSLLHQCPDSSPAAYNPVAFDIVTLVSRWASLTFPRLGRWCFHAPFKNNFYLSDWWVVMGSQSGIGCSNELANFLSTSRGGSIRMIKVGIEHWTIVWQSIKMCTGSNIFPLHPRTGVGKQVGGFWELGGRLGSPGFKGSSGNLPSSKSTPTTQAFPVWHIYLTRETHTLHYIT